MKRRLAFIVPALLLLGFLAIKPPAIGSQSETVVVTPTSTTTQASKPHLRDFDDDGNEPEHGHEDGREEGHEHGHEHGHEEGHGFESDEGDDD